MASGLSCQLLLLLLLLRLLNFCQCAEDQSLLYTIDTVELQILPGGSVDSGTAVSLRCEVSVSHDPSLRLTHRFHFVQNDRQVHSLNTSEAVAVYALAPARAADSGKYECLVDVEDKSRRSVPRELIVKGLQTPVLHLSNTTLFEGVEVTATCSAPQEKGSLLYYFYQEDPRSAETRRVKQVGPSGSTAETRLVLRRAGDSLLYCDYDITTLPEAGRSNASNKVQVIVRVLDFTPIMNVLPSTTVYEGDVIEVVCRVVNPPGENVEVYLNKDKRVLKKAVVGLSHRYTVQSGESGNFVCKAEWGNTPREANKFVQVKDLFSAPRLRMDPVDVFEGEQLTLSCSVAKYAPERISNDSMKFSIYRGRVRLTMTDKYSTTARASMNGNYTCRVEVVDRGHTFRKDSETVVLKARVPVSKPMLSVVGGRLVVGKPFLLRCHSLQGSLPITYTLFGPLLRPQDVRVVSAPGDDAVFNISAIQKATDLKKFLCHARNKEDSPPMVSAEMRLDAQVIIEPVSKPMLTLLPNTGVATEGQDLTIICSVQRGTPPITFTWYHTGRSEPLHTQTVEGARGSYVIKGVRGEDEGGYYCVGSNQADVGNNQADDSKSSFVVTVGVKQAGWKKGLIAAFCILLITAVILVIIIKKGRLPLRRKRTGELSVKSASTKAERLSLTQAEAVTANVTPGVMGRNVWSEHVSGSESDDQNSVVVPAEEPETQYTEVQTTRPLDPNRAPVKKGTDTVYSEVRNSKQGAPEQADSGSVEYAQLNRDNAPQNDHHNHNDHHHSDHHHTHPVPPVDHSSVHAVQADAVVDHIADGHAVDDPIDDLIDDIDVVELTEGGECNGEHVAPDC